MAQSTVVFRQFTPSSYIVAVVDYASVMNVVRVRSISCSSTHFMYAEIPVCVKGVACFDAHSMYTHIPVCIKGLIVWIHILYIHRSLYT